MHEMTPEDAAADFADNVAVRELRQIRDALTAKIREAYLAGYAHARNESEREDWIDPTDVDALANALNAFGKSTIEDLAPKYTDLRDAMREGWVDPGDSDAVIEAAAELIGEGKMEVCELLLLVDNDRIDDSDLADYIGDASVCQIPDELRDVLATGFDLHGIDTLGDLATELAWQLSLGGAA